MSRHTVSYEINYGRFGDCLVVKKISPFGLVLGPFLKKLTKLKLILTRLQISKQGKEKVHLDDLQTR